MGIGQCGRKDLDRVESGGQGVALCKAVRAPDSFGGWLPGQALLWVQGKLPDGFALLGELQCQLDERL